MLVELVVVAFLVWLVMRFMRGQNAPYAATAPHIQDKYDTVEQVSHAIRQAGLESCNLVIAIDYTKSNETQGRFMCEGLCLHHLDAGQLNGGAGNPYQQVISVIARTLTPFDEDGLIPVFGFGDITTKGHGVFNIKPDGQPCQGLDEVLACYNTVTQDILNRNALSGPTNFAPAIRRAIDIVRASGNDYHILVIIADGQVTNEAETVEAIVEASAYPLSIVMVGVGDGPWDMMRQFDDSLPQRQFDNFQFVDFHRAVQRSPHPDASFAVNALMEIPDQFLTARRLGLIGRRVR